MTFFDIRGTDSFYFQIGIKGSGERILRFKNDFASDLKWNPTASRILQLPDASGILGIAENITTYESPGSFSISPDTWRLYKSAYILQGSGGAGAGSGRCASSGDRYGGGGGGAGCWADIRLSLDWIFAKYGNYPLDIVIGSGGNGGAAVTGTSDGNPGVDGGFSSISINGIMILYCLGGTAGSGGTTTTGNGGSAPSYGINIGSAGGASSITANASNGASSNIASSGGGGGGGVSATGNGFGGGSSNAAARGFTGNNAAVSRGLSSGGLGTDGASASISNPVERPFPIPGQGGGGGGAGSTTTGGKGGDGFRGGGGGGGGAGTTGSGAGGKGGNGYGLVILS